MFNWVLNKSLHPVLQVIKRVQWNRLSEATWQSSSSVFFLFLVPETSSTSLREIIHIRSFFLVRISPHSDWIRRDKYLSVFSPNAGKHGPEKLRIRTIFTQHLAITFYILLYFFSPLMYNHTTSSQLYYKYLQYLQRLHA